VPITERGLAAENNALTRLLTADAAALAHKLLAAGVQTRWGELCLEKTVSDSH
jgi:hypothetical protein